MSECFRCGVSGENEQLYDTISNKGIIKLCKRCSVIEGFPVIKRPTTDQLSEAQKPRQMRDRPGMTNRKFVQGEVSLRALVDQKFKSQKVQPPSDLKDNFHWLIQRIRRERKITREQFAKAIGESEAVVRMLEQGFLPESNYKIINKVEDFLGISLRKAGSSGFPDTSQVRKFVLDNSLVEKEEKELKELKFDREATKQLRISDLKIMKKKHDDGAKQAQRQVESWEEEYPQDDERFLDPSETEDFEEEGRF